VDVTDFINIALIILSISLIALILLQARGGAIGGMFDASAGGQYKARRGLQKTLFNVTIGTSVVFFLLVVVEVFILRGRG